jgi:uncharacterized membrane protein YdjX (TVP38/TMEM64 family)
MIVELLIVFATSFGLNLIPFVSPSNLFIASSSALILGVGASDPTSLIVIGCVVALGATLAKSIHYLVSFFIGKHLREKHTQRLESQTRRVKRWAFLLLFVTAASPIPDEPVVIPLGLLKYSPIRFFCAFFLGKILITIAGAFIGSWTANAFSGWISNEAMIAFSILLTAIITVILLKRDLGAIFVNYIKGFCRRINKRLCVFITSPQLNLFNCL